MTSQRQIEANRENAQRSTGPRTAEGKAIVALNAVKHGVFAREAVILAGDGREDEEVYARLLGGLHDALQPEGQMEHLLVEKIAVNYWRLRRLVRYETGEIRQALDEFMEEALKEFYDPDHAPWGRAVPEQPPMEFYHYGDSVSDEDLAAQRDRTDRIEEPDWRLEEDDEALEFVFRHKVRGSGCEDALPHDWRKRTLAYLKPLSPQQKGKIRREALCREEQILIEMMEVRRWNQKFEVLKRVLAIPTEADLDKVVKYETALERSVFRNLDALRRLQEARSGRSRGQAELAGGADAVGEARA